MDDKDVDLLKAAFSKIDNFIGEFEFLALDYECRMEFMHVSFPTLYHCLFFCKYSHKSGENVVYLKNGSSLSDEVHKIAKDIASCELGRVKDLSSEDNMNPHWDEFRLDWIECMLRDRYRRNSDLREKLRKTGDREIIYNLGDLFLGCVGKCGQNQLGRLTGIIRREVVECKDHLLWLAMCQNMCNDPFDVVLNERNGNERVDHELKGKFCYHIGRHATCDLRPLNPSISRIHASLYLEKSGRVRIVNYNDQGGVKVNDIRLDCCRPFTLRDGDDLTLGTSTRVYRIYLDEEPSKKHAQNLRNIKYQLGRKVAQKHRDLESELDTYLHGSKEIVVTNVSFKTKRADLYDFFGLCGEIDSVILPQNRGRYGEDFCTMDSDDAEARGGVAFVTFRDKSAASKALEKDGTFLNYRRINVMYKDKDRWRPNVRRSRSRSR